MPTISPKLLLFGAIVVGAALVVVGFAFLILRGSPEVRDVAESGSIPGSEDAGSFNNPSFPEGSSGSGVGEKAESGGGIPQENLNVFVPVSGLETQDRLSISPSPPNVPSVGQGFQTELPPPPTIPGLAEFEQALRELANLPGSVLAPSVPAGLPLPLVLDGEMTISLQGIASTEGYLEYFAQNQTNGTAFDYTKFGQALKDGDGVTMLVPALLDKALSDKNFGAIHNSLLVQKEFTAAKLAFLKSVPVTGEAAELGRTMIAFDKLTLELIEDAFAVESGKLSAGELREILSLYDEAATLRHEQFVNESGLLASQYHGTIFYKLAKLLGLVDVAFAQVMFGGPITFTHPCTCPPTGIQIFVGAPVGGAYYLTTPFLASPLFFPFRAPHIGAFILGLFTPVPLSCDVIPLCVGSFFPPVIMAGTSP